MDKQRTVTDFVQHHCGCDLCRFDPDDLPPARLPAMAVRGVRAVRLAGVLGAGGPDTAWERREALARAQAALFETVPGH